jgi:hypothetical protein
VLLLWTSHGDSVLGLSHFLQISQLPQKVTVAFKLVKSDTQIIYLLSKSLSITHFEVCRYFYEVQSTLSSSLTLAFRQLFLKVFFYQITSRYMVNNLLYLIRRMGTSPRTCSKRPKNISLRVQNLLSKKNVISNIFYSKICL